MVREGRPERGLNRALASPSSFSARTVGTATFFDLKVKFVWLLLMSGLKTPSILVGLVKSVFVCFLHKLIVSVELSLAGNYFFM